MYIVYWNSCNVVSWSEAASEPPKVVRTPSVSYILTPQRHALQHPNLQKWSDAGVFSAVWLRNMLRATTTCTFSTSETPKVARTCGVLYILTSKCASRHNDVHFFNIRTSKSGVNMWCFVHFDLEMCNDVHFFNIPTFKSGARAWDCNDIVDSCEIQRNRQGNYEGNYETLYGIRTG